MGTILIIKIIKKILAVYPVVIKKEQDFNQIYKL